MNFGNLKIPVYHLDRYFFQKQRVERPDGEFLQIQRELVAKEAWVIDGNAIHSLEMRYSCADLVLYFRFSRLRCLWRLFKRTFSKDPRICDRAKECPEKVRLRLIRYMWQFDRRVQPTLSGLQRSYPHVEFRAITTTTQLQKFLEAL